MATSVHDGLHVNSDGYLRVHRGPHRMKYAHRVYMEHLIGRPLRDDEEVDHLCGNRMCWPPTDFHLCLMDSVIHHAISAGRIPFVKRNARFNRKRHKKKIGVAR